MSSRLAAITTPSHNDVAVKATPSTVSGAMAATAVATASRRIRESTVGSSAASRLSLLSDILSRGLAAEAPACVHLPDHCRQEDGCRDVLRKQLVGKLFHPGTIALFGAPAVVTWCHLSS
ncbi:hypothetical protein H9651_03040 [Microbacterium sp. Sa4CUA7]|uniref:Uncharacterized protein n=1 Tax=Microbacterium pullorum TaxID=2762236 RepID=A0ABR8RZG8_9MICO|nr:hypothetical protein [Microbacterium pullorum]